MKKRFLFLSVFLVVFVAAALLVLNKTNRGIDERQAWRDKNLMKIQFKGRIIKTKEITRSGRYHDIACLQLDYCNIDSCYFYIPDLVFLKIANGKAVMPIPTGTSKGEIDYIEVNIDHSGKENFYKGGKLEDSYDIELSSAGLLEEDLRFCGEGEK